MATLIEDPTQVTLPGQPPPSKGRRWWLIPLVLILSLPVGIFVRDRWVDAYQPILVGNGSFSFDVSGPQGKEVRRYDTHAHEADEPTEIALIPFQKGGTLRMVFPIFHDGGQSIRITDVSYGPDPARFVTVLRPAGAEVGSQRTNNPTRTTEAFHPFTLNPEDNPLIGLNYDFVCQKASPNTSEIIDTFRLRFEMLGGSRWVELTLPWRLVLGHPSKEDCPPGSAVFGS
jgi:hypothetical protein